MIQFEDQGTDVVLVYASDRGSVTWVDEKLGRDGTATLARTFTVRREDARGFEEDEEVRRFVIGTVEGDYRVIRKDVLGLKRDLLVTRSVPLERKTFIAERDISIFRQVDGLVDEQIVIGGTRSEAIPGNEFARLLHDFPTSTELRRYAQARVQRVVGEYFETMSDAEQNLADYMARRARPSVEPVADTHGRIQIASELELEKFTYVRDRLVEMLGDAESYSEADWQTAVADLFLLVFPQYVAVLQHVKVKEWYSKAPASTTRDIDVMLVAANGCVDIIEIKKPFERSLVSSGKYRHNHIPVRELSGSLMQAEKYLFYLSKSGRDGEKEIATKHAATIPAGLEIRIANPKAIILSGRDNDLSDGERFDFEFARRAYSNVVDIISYDDLHRRLDNIIASLTSRVSARTEPSALAEIGESA